MVNLSAAPPCACKEHSCVLRYRHMETLKEFLPWIQIVLAVLTVMGVLLQQSEAGLGASFGGSSSAGSFHTKRGLEKVLFIGTIIVATAFVVSSLIALTLLA